MIAGQQFTAASRPAQASQTPPAPIGVEDEGLRRVLVVDDDIDFAETVAEMLERQGFGVLAVHTAAAAREAALRFNPQVALVDVQLHHDSGLSLLSDLHTQLPRLLCVVVTAHASADSAIKALREGAYDFVRKPFHPEELLATLERCFERLRLEQEKRDTDAQLRQSQKLEALGQLTGGVAHDFNNLLTVISGGLELIRDQLELGSEPHALLERVQQAANTATGLTQRLLAFSRKQPLDPRETDINVLVQGMQSLLESTLGESIELRLHFGRDLPNCSVDAAQLETALLNLVFNARDAVSLGGVVSVRTALHSVEPGERASDVKPGDYVMLSVSDDGRGMSNAVAQRAFDPFFTTKPMGKGTGLGLSMIYGFARQSGGFVDLLSEEGHGSTFQLYLPACRQSSAPPQPKPTKAPAGQSQRVLLVEDNEHVRATTEALLRSLGYQVSSVPDGEQALAHLDQDEQLALVVTDLGLPGGLSGWDVAAAALVRRPNIGVLVMSGYLDQPEVGSRRPNANLTVLPKPFDRTSLAAAIHAALDQENIG